MNLSKEERRIVVGMELEKADRIFAEYEVLQKAGFWSTLVNRLYYSAFHAVSALLINDGYEVGTHKGAVIRFQQYYVKTGKFSVEDGRFYSQLQTMRESADYNCSYEVTEEEVISRIEPVRLLIDKIKQYIALTN
ncbi:MAG: HEPN domain-containing protein [Bacteroidales bacterium]|nr:HEPN domain-containing protein [Bacteroidales bacterium]MBQ6276196.1 HEPN domain-containing protein [Bacteroidales bacterium]